MACSVNPLGILRRLVGELKNYFAHCLCSIHNARGILKSKKIQSRSILFSFNLSRYKAHKMCKWEKRVFFSLSNFGESRLRLCWILSLFLAWNNTLKQSVTFDCLGIWIELSINCRKISLRYRLLRELFFENLYELMKKKSCIRVTFLLQI